MNMKQKLDDVLARGAKNGHVPGVVAATTPSKLELFIPRLKLRTPALLQRMLVRLVLRLEAFL